MLKAANKTTAALGISACNPEVCKPNMPSDVFIYLLDAPHLEKTKEELPLLSLLHDVCSRHAEEVVEILVNMSQGKVAADSKDLDDDMSDAASVTSEQDAAVFIPRVARPRAGVKPPRHLSSANVVVDSEVLIPDLTMPEDGDRVAGNLPAQTIIKEANIVDDNQALFAGPEEAAVTQRGAVRVTAGQSIAGPVSYTHLTLPTSSTV